MVFRTSKILGKASNYLKERRLGIPQDPLKYSSRLDLINTMMDKVKKYWYNIYKKKLGKKFGQKMINHVVSKQ